MNDGMRIEWADLGVDSTPAKEGRHPLAGLRGDSAEAVYVVAGYLRRRAGRHVPADVIVKELWPELFSGQLITGALLRLTDGGALARRHATADPLMPEYRWIDGSTLPCPACGAPAQYVAELDRYVHADGSGNAPCWLAVVRGETEFRPGRGR